MELKCKNCGNEWNYKGKSKYYATCSVCYYKVKINKETKDEEVSYDDSFA